MSASNGRNLLEKKNQSLLPNVRNYLVRQRLEVVNGRCRDRCGLHQYKQRLLSFSLGKPRRQISEEKGHKTGYSLVQIVQDVLGGLGRSWAVLGGLGQSWPVLTGFTLLTKVGPEPK